jgi:hypothetical protein
MFGLFGPALAVAVDIQMPLPDGSATIVIEGESAEHWQQGAVEAWVIQRGTIRQDVFRGSANELVAWIDRAPTDSQAESRVTIYLEGAAQVDYQRSGDAHAETGTAAQSIRDHSWFGKLTTRGSIDVRAPVRTDVQSVKPAVYQRAEQAWDDASRGGRTPATFASQPALVSPPGMPPTALPMPPGGASAQPRSSAPPLTGPPFAVPPSSLQPPMASPTLQPPTFGGPAMTGPAVTGPVVNGPIESLPPGPLAPVPVSEKRVQVGPRSNAPIHIKSFPGNMPNQSVTVFSNGLRALIEGVEAPQMGNLGRIVIETDRLVLWGPNLKSLTSAGSEVAGGGEVPIEVYMEGNIVFRQGDRLIYADRMYYNATYEYGVVLAAEVFTPVPDYQGVVRLKADVLQQVNRQHFEAFGAAVTTSQMGVPKYWFQSERIGFTDTQLPRINPLTGMPDIDSRTQEIAVDHELLATSKNNFLYLGGLPVLYWPVMATDLRKPSYYLERFALRNDDVFGGQVLADWDVYQLFNVKDPPKGTDLFLSTDYLSERGFGLGTTVEYQRDEFLGHAGPVNGWFDAWGIRDGGLDDLGRNRLNVVPDTENRGRAYWRHRQDLPDGWQVTAQLGWVTDRNFLEQYFEKEWDEWTDHLTVLNLKRTWDDQSLGIRGQYHLNPYVSQTDWWPRGDHFLLGRSFLNDYFTWYAHSHASYTRFNVLNSPTDPQDLNGWSYLPWEQPTMEPEGGRFATRQEVDLPFQLGPVRVVPYGLGEAGYWGQGLDEQDDIARFYGQAGVRASLPLWKVHPTVQSMLFNLNGLAHKVTLVSDFYYADASQDISEFPLYDPLDDDSQEHFRNYLGPYTANLDPRLYAFRAGMQNWVAAPSAEMVDDVMAARLGIHQRWQTKRGQPGQQRVVDWIILDVDGTIFPEADRDNFGKYLGLLEYDFRWHVGDRVSILSDGYADFFQDGLSMISLGTALTRPERGQLYGGIVNMEGPFSSTLLVGTASYRLSQKWIFDLSGTYDLGPAGNIGERLAITHVGESIVVRLAANADFGRDNFGIGIAIEPRFLPKGRLGRIGDMPIPPLGSMGIE